MKKIALVGVIVTAFSLVSCGGSTTIPKDVVIPGSAQSQVGTPTYAQGTEEWAAFRAINSYRQSMGLGYWQQSVFLDQAAQKHMLYSTSNPQIQIPFQTDIEIAGNANFTGTTPSARAILTGYYYLENTVTATNVPTASVGELYATGTASTPGGQDFINSMVNTIYHRSGLLTQATVQMGLARDTTGTITPGTTTHWWISHGRLTSAQSVASNYVAVYPINNQTNVPLHMDEEVPSVYASTPGGYDYVNKTSSPVSITLSSLVNITVTSFTVTPATCATPPCAALPGNIWTMSNDPNLNTSDYSSATVNLTAPPNPVPTIPGYEAFWVGVAPFKPNTTYNVSLVGTTYLIPYAITNPITQTWNFTTGNGS